MITSERYQNSTFRSDILCTAYKTRIGVIFDIFRSCFNQLKIERKEFVPNCFLWRNNINEIYRVFCMGNITMFS